MAKANKTITVEQHVDHAGSTEKEIKHVYFVKKATNAVKPVIGQKLTKTQVQELINKGYTVHITEIK